MDIHICGKEDRFALFLAGMGRSFKNLDTEYRQYLDTMKQTLLHPLTQFNKFGQINSSEELKYKLKTKKAEFDLSIKTILKLEKNQKQRKSVNLATIHNARQKSKAQMEELVLLRNDFLESMRLTDMEKRALVHPLRAYMSSMNGYARYCAAELDEKDDANILAMYWLPPNYGNRLNLDADTEDINDQELILSTFAEWTKKETHIVVKEAYIFKNGTRRWFKLYANKQLLWFSEKWKGSIRGRIDLANVTQIVKKPNHSLHVMEESTLWHLQFVDDSERNIWHQLLLGFALVDLAKQNETDYTDLFMDVKVAENEESKELSSQMVHSDGDESESEGTAYFTLSEIVQLVTSPHTNNKHQTVLLHTYCLFTTRNDLLDVIFDILSASTNDQQTQIKVMSLLRTWLKFENDFKNETDDDETKLSPFALKFSRDLFKNTENNSMLQQIAKPIISQISQPPKDDMPTQHRMSQLDQAPTPKLPKDKNAKNLDLNQLNPEEVARQITLIEYAIFCKIKSSEFLQHKPNKKRRKKMTITDTEDHNQTEKILQTQLKKMKKMASINEEKESLLVRMTNWFNKLVIWTQCEILGQNDLTQRVKVLTNLLKVCDKLDSFNNLSSLCAVHSGLCSVPIYRLKKTWDHLPKKAKEIKLRMDLLFKLDKSRKNLRNRISIISQPAIPPLAIFLADITFIDDGNKTLMHVPAEPGGDVNGDMVVEKINWGKMKLLADRINWISMFQQSPFIFKRVPIICEYLESKMQAVPDDFLYKLSRSLES